MASPLNNALRLVKPGEMVIPVAEILDKLGDRLTADEKEQVLVAILSRRTDRVRPGDLITSDLLNQLLAQVADLQAQVLALQGKEAQQPAKVRIDRIKPSGTVLTVDELVTIEGANFEHSIKAAAVYFGGKKVPLIHEGSSDQLLIVNVPDPGFLAEEGSVIDLVVSNRASTDSIPVKVKSKPVPLWGDVLITPGAIQPDPVASGKPARFGYTLTSAASRTATFTLTPRLAAGSEPFDPPKFGSIMGILDSTDTVLPKNEIRLVPGAPVRVFVALTEVPFKDKAKFSIQLTAKADSAGGNSPVKTYTVGAANNDDDFLNVDLGGLDDPGKLVDGEVRLAPKASVIASLTVTLTAKAIQAGLKRADFEITQTVAPGTSGWSAFLTNAGGAVTEASPAGVEMEIAADADPSKTGRIDVTVSRKDQAGVAKTKQYGILLRRT